MAKLTQDQMFRYIDMITDWLEDRIGQDVVMVQNLDRVEFHSGKPAWKVLPGQYYLFEQGCYGDRTVPTP